MNDAKNLAPPKPDADLEERIAFLEEKVEMLTTIVQVQYDNVNRILTILERDRG